MRHIAMVGSGAWGSAFARAIRQGCRLTFWARDNAAAVRAADFVNTADDCGDDSAASFAAVSVNSIAQAAKDAEVIVLAVSSGGFAEVLKKIKPFAAAVPIIWLSKGFVGDDDKLPCEFAADILGEDGCYGALSGPSFAAEVSRGQPTALALALNHQRMLRPMQEMFHRQRLRIYPSDDLPGVCAAGALKNIVAIAAGICDGMNLGTSARAALITRGLAEMRAIGAALGGSDDTMMGVAGVGDLLLTCTSDLSRNRQLGLSLGAGGRRADMLCEGARAAPRAWRRAQQAGIDAPIIKAVCDILAGGAPAAAMTKLLSRPAPI